MSRPRYAIAAAIAAAVVALAAPAAQGAVVTETFTGTDGTALEDHVGEVGATWTWHPNYPAYVRLQSGRGWGPEWGLYFASGIPATAEYDVTADIHVKSNTGAMGIVARASTSGTDNLYMARYNAATTRWELVKCSGSCTVLASYSQTLTVGTTYALKLEVRNGTKKLFVNGVERASSTDNTITQVGRAGIRTGPGTGPTSTAGYHIDNFVVENAAPDTSITGGPSGATNNASPSFTFTSSPSSGATFQCKLDGPGTTTGTWGSCTSPKAYSSLAQGSYTFNVRSTVGGVTDPTPATRAFTVDTTAPDTTITSGPSGTITVSSASFGFSSEAGATFECKLDGPGTTTGTYGSCTSPKGYSSLANGSYTFSVRAKDAANNTDATPATRAFTVNVTATGCDQTASTSGPITTPAGLISALSTGQTGCFRAGTYGSTSTEISVNKDVTIKSYPGETATLVGRIVVPGAGAGATIQDLVLDGRSTSHNPSPTINAANVTIADNDISHRNPANPSVDAGICVSPSTWNGTSGDNAIIERNRIHDCGIMPRNNHHHGIYITDADGVIIRNNAIFDNADRGIQLYPSATNTQVYNNTVDNNATGIIISNNSAGNDVYDNIFSNAYERFNIEQSQLVGTGNTVTDNCLYASTGNSYFDQNGGVDPNIGSPEVTLSGNVVANPNYVDRSGKDFRDTNSSCSGKGAPDDVAQP